MQTTNQASDKGSVDDSGNVRVPVVIEEDEETPPEDPLVVEARTAANKECDKVRWFTDLKALKEQLKIEVLASSHSVVSSKMRKHPGSRSTAPTWKTLVS